MCMGLGCAGGLRGEQGNRVAGYLTIMIVLNSYYTVVTVYFV